MREGVLRRNQTCAMGTASSICPMRSRRTLDSVTSTPQRSQMTPLFLTHLYFAAVTFPVADGAENALAEKAVALGLERAVIDRLGLTDFAVGPGQNLLRARQADANRVKIGEIELFVGLFLFLAGRCGSCVREVAERTLRPPWIRRDCFGCFSAGLRSQPFFPRSARTSSIFNPSARSSRASTLKDSGTPGSENVSPLIMASYILARPATSSDFTVKNSCRQCAAP